MINLIPPKGHKTLKHEYLLRVGSVYSFMLAGVLVSASVLLIPTYVLISAQLNTVEKSIPEASEATAEFIAAEKEIKQANTTITQLRTFPRSLSISTIIREIVSKTPEKIVFKTFEAHEEKGVLKSIQVQGVAPSRTELASLKNKIEESPLFKTATVPIGDLAKDADLPFAITILLKEAAKE